MKTYWVRRNGRYVECEERGGQLVEVKRTPEQKPSRIASTRKTIVEDSGSVEVRLFEAVRDTHLGLSEYRIGLLAGTAGMDDFAERLAALRTALKSLESSLAGSDADVAIRLSVSRAVAGMRSALDGSHCLDQQAIGQAATELRKVLGCLERRDACTNSGLRAKALAQHARFTANDDEVKYGLR